MKLLDFGTGATSRITGSPINFYLWLTMQITEGLANPE